MKILEISVPDMNDSFSSVVLDRKQYLIRFSWNDYAQRWAFGLHDMQREPISIGIRMVPRFPLTLQTVDERMPGGTFGVYFNGAAPGRKDFVDGNAKFAYVPALEES